MKSAAVFFVVALVACIAIISLSRPEDDPGRVRTSSYGLNLNDPNTELRTIKRTIATCAEQAGLRSLEDAGRSATYQACMARVKDSLPR